MKIALLVITVVVLLLAALVWYGQRRWNEVSQTAAERLWSSAAKPTVERFSSTQLVGLPAPVARYFRTVLKEGQPIITRATIEWKGEFNMGKPGADQWKPFTATQHVVPGAPGFVWNARVDSMPGVAALVRDAFVDQQGSMHAAIAGWFTVVNTHDTPDIAAGALYRYLGEAAWLPTALLPSQGVTWTAIDDQRALATLSAGSTTLSVEFRFGADGLVQSGFVPDRVFDGDKKPHAWEGRYLRFAEMNGIMVPVESQVQWNLPSGAFAYWRGTPAHINYDYATEARAK